MSVALCFLSSLIQKEVMRVWKTLNGEGMIRLHDICKLIIGLKNCFSKRGLPMIFHALKLLYHILTAVQL